MTQGPAVPAFERAVCEKVGAKYGVAVNSATSALHVACLALELGPGDILWTVPNTFVASANCALYCGAAVDFVDIDPVSWNISISDLERRLEIAETRARLPKVLVSVHFAGQPTVQEAIRRLAVRYGFRIIEDASHSMGASRLHEQVGSCRWSDITVFSFHPVKIITTGEGGMALTNDHELAQRMSGLRSHGITREDTLFTAGGTATNDGAWYYEQQSLGFNYRMTDIAAALGMSQLGRVDQSINERNRLASIYTDALQDAGLRLPVISSENRSAFHLYVVRIDRDHRKALRRKIFDEMRRMRIGVNVHYIPVHLQPYYRAQGFVPGQYPEAEAHGESAITLPCYPGLKEGDQDRVIESLRSALSN